EVTLRHHAVGDVAPRAPADEDLRANAAGPVDADNAELWRVPRAEDGRGQAGSSGTDHDDIDGYGTIGHRTSATVERSMRHATCTITDRGPRPSSSLRQAVSDCRGREE